MIRIEKTEVVGWGAAIRGMRNPMNSWDKSDSLWNGEFNFFDGNPNWEIGPNDLNLMMRLATGGPVHAKYRRMITVYCDITAPLYWWKEFDTYKVGTVANSCSTMHKIHAKEFTLEDFSHEHLFEGDDWEFAPITVLVGTIIELNKWRERYLDTKDKEYWWQMIQLLPSSYNQKRTIMFNYEVLSHMYNDRKNHKLDEWHEFCDWVEILPYSEIITGPFEAYHGQEES